MPEVKTTDIQYRLIWCVALGDFIPVPIVDGQMESVYVPDLTMKPEA